MRRRGLDHQGLSVALPERRLDATRRPSLRPPLAHVTRDSFKQSLRFHRRAGLPGDRTEVLPFYLAMRGLLIEGFTLPNAWSSIDLDAGLKVLARRLAVSCPALPAGTAPAGAGAAAHRLPRGGSLPFSFSFRITASDGGG